MKLLLILLLVLVAFMLLTIFLIAPSRPKKALSAPFLGRSFAHRGLHTKEKDIPENSLAAFRRAADAGYGIELDIQFSKDGKVVVFHDNTLNRVCGIDGRVDSYTLEELQGFRLCGTNERIPLFTEVLAAVGGRVPLIVELKNGPRNKELCEKGLAILRDYKGIYCIESFQPMIVRWFKKNAPDILRGQLSAPPKEFKGELAPAAAWALGNVLTNFLARPQFLAYHKQKTSLTARLCTALGALRVVWTVRDSDDIKKITAQNDVVIFEFYLPEK